MGVVKIHTVETKASTTGKSFVKLVDTNGGVYSVWADPRNPRLYDDARMLSTGSLVNIDFVQNGKFRNVKAIAPASDLDSHEVVVPSLDELKGGAPVKQAPFFNDRKDRRISRLACINASIEFHKLVSAIDQTTCTENDIMTTAEKFEAHVYRGMEE